MTQIILENSLLWLFPIALVAALASWFLYFRANSFTQSQRIPLAVLRFLSLFFLGFLLLSPLLKSSKIREEKPILLWLEDHSISMSKSIDSSLVIQNFNNYNIPNAISEKYDVKSFDFTNELLEPSDTFSGQSTDLYEAILEASEKYYNQNVGALVLHSDGIYNRGINPSYAAANLPFPIYTVGYGDTTFKKDIFIEKIISNKVGYVKNNLPAEVYVRARQLAGKSANLTVTNAAGTKVYSQTVKISSDDYFERISFFVKAEKPGIQRYNVSIQPLADESNITNNNGTFAIEVLDNKKKIYIIANGPHPDIGAINSALKQLERYDVQTTIYNKWNGELPEADLYILHDPSEGILQKFEDSKKPLWIIVGPNISESSLANVAGVKLDGGSFEDVYPVWDNNFNLFNTDENYQLKLDDMPPLLSPFGDVTAAEPIYSLMTKKIGSVTTRTPLWFFLQGNEQRKAVILGTGIWRWRIYDYKENQNHEAFDRLISKSIQYLTTDARRQRFVVDMPARLEEGKALMAEARLYNKSLELTNEPELKITFKNEEGSEYDFSFAKAQSTYSLNAGRLPEGIYQYRSEVSLGDETFSREGSLVIERSNLEEADLVARHHVLRKLGKESGGAYFKANELSNLEAKLLENNNAKTITYEETSTDSLVNEKWLFALFVLFLTLEWALRKYFGKY